jgi:glycosyltransferase involved in cell wall biosynthesis
MYLAEALAKKGHEVHVLHSIDAYRAKRKNKISKMPFSDNKIFVHSVETFISRKEPALAYLFGRSPAVSRRFSSILKNEYPDVVHHHNISLLGYNILKKQQPYLSLYTAHDFWLICQKNNLMRSNGSFCSKKNCFSCAIRWKCFPQIWRHFNGFKKAIENIDLLISPSDYVQKRLLLDLKINSHVIPNFVPKPPREIYPSDFSNYFLFVGGLEKHKGIMNLLEVFRRSGDKIGARLLIAGDGSLRGDVKHLIEANSLEDKILVMGSLSRERLYPLYAGAKALILPSICPENSPLVLLEAMSVGTPTLATDCGGSPEIVGKVNKSLIIGSKLSDLESAILNFSEGKYDHNLIMKIYEDNYSPDVYVKRYLECLKNTSGS